MVASSSRTQKSISLSSCEAELLALTAACAEGIFLREAVSFCTQRPAELIVYTDSASARQFLARQGLGRLRHLDLRLLWLQDLVRSHQLRLSAVPGPENLADLQTKALKADRIRYLLHGFKVRDEANSDELVGVAEATANEDRFAISAAVRAVRSYRGPASKLSLLLQALTIVDSFTACVAQGREDTLSGYGLLGFAVFAIFCMIMWIVLRFCRAPVLADETQPELEPDVSDHGGDSSSESSDVRDATAAGSNDVPVTAIVPVTTPVPKQAPVLPPATVTVRHDPNDLFVYYTRYGECMHSLRDCRGLRSAKRIFGDPLHVVLRVRPGLRPCMFCGGPIYTVLERLRAPPRVAVFELPLGEPEPDDQSDASPS